MKYDVFISYQSLSINIVNTIAHVFEDEGIKCWYAKELANSAGKMFNDKIAKSLKASRMLVVVLTDEALRSEWVNNEVTRALNQDKVVIPFVVSPLNRDIEEESGLLLQLEAKQRIDAYPNPERKFSLLVKNVKISLNEAIAENASLNESPQFNIEEDNFAIDFDFDEGKILFEAKQYNDAARALLASAERGNSMAKELLCQMFYDISGKISIISEDVWDNIDRQAQLGHSYAYFLMHCKNYNNPETNLVAFEYLKKTIRNNPLPLALLRLGVQHSWGLGGKPNHTLSIYYYNKAMEMGCKEAYGYLGCDYLYGNDVVKKDIEKAKMLFEKGIELNDKRSMSCMVSLYIDELNDIDKARELAQIFIDNGYPNGHCLMGDTFLGRDWNDIPEENRQEAIRWFRKGLLNEEEKAYGKLAWLYMYDDREEAYALAKRGKFLHDSFSVGILGSLYLQDNNLEESWKCFEECYEKFGNRANSLGMLYFDYDFKPENLNLDNLEKALDVCARNADEDSLKYIIRLCKIRANRSSDLDYEEAKEVQKATEYVRLGAEMGITDMMYYWGTYLMNEENERLYNPERGLDWIEKAAEQNDDRAMSSFFKYRSEGKHQDNDKLRQFIIKTISKPKYTDEYLTHALKDIGGKEPEIKDIYLDFLYSVIQKEYVNKDLLYSAVGKFLNLRNKEDVFDGERLECIQKLIERERIEGNLGYLIYLGNNLSILYPNYNENVGRDDFMKGKNTVDATLYYALASSGMTSEVNLKEMDTLLKSLLSPITNDQCINSITKNENDILIGGEEIWSQPLINLQDSYRKICNEFNIEPIKFKRCDFKDIVPFFPADLASNYRRKSFECLLSISSCEPLIEGEFLKHSASDEELLNVCEKITNQNVQLFLISYVELKIDVESLLLNYKKLYNSYKKSEYQVLADYVNKYISRLHNAQIKCELNEFSIDDIYKLLHSNQQQEIINKEDVMNYGSSDDEFERLLNEFINSSTETKGE